MKARMGRWDHPGAGRALNPALSFLEVLDRDAQAREGVATARSAHQKLQRGQEQSPLSPGRAPTHTWLRNPLRPQREHLCCFMPQCVARAPGVAPGVLGGGGWAQDRASCWAGLGWALVPKLAPSSVLSSRQNRGRGRGDSGAWAHAEARGCCRHLTRRGPWPGSWRTWARPPSCPPGSCSQEPLGFSAAPPGPSLHRASCRERDPASLISAEPSGSVQVFPVAVSRWGLGATEATGAAGHLAAAPHTWKLISSWQMKQG